MPITFELRRYSHFLPEVYAFSRIYSTDVKPIKPLINALYNAGLDSNKLEKMAFFASKYKVFISALIKLEASDMASLLLRSNFLLFFRVFSFPFPRKVNNDTTKPEGLSKPDSISLNLVVSA